MKTSHYIIYGICLVALSACAKTKETFDFSKKAPDEFAVTTRAPLEIPSDLATLPPPRPGAPRPQEQAVEEQARQAIFGSSDNIVTNTEATATPAINDKSISQGENILLEKTGALGVTNDIRNTIDAETEKLAEENISTFDKLMGKVGKKTDAPVNVIDPIKESERILIDRKTGQATALPQK